MSVNSLHKTVTRQRRGCDLNPGPTAPESSTLTTWLPSNPKMIIIKWKTGIFIFRYPFSGQTGLNLNCMCGSGYAFWNFQYMPPTIIICYTVFCHSYLTCARYEMVGYLVHRCFVFVYSTLRQWSSEFSAPEADHLLQSLSMWSVQACRNSVAVLWFVYILLKCD